MGVMIEGFVKAPETGKYRFFTSSDDSSEVWVAYQPNVKSPLTKVVELQGCCRQVAGTTRVQWTAGLRYFMMALVKEHGGGEYLYVGFQRDGGGKKYMPIPISMFSHEPNGQIARSWLAAQLGCSLITTATLRTRAVAAARDWPSAMFTCCRCSLWCTVLPTINSPCPPAQKHR